MSDEPERERLKDPSWSHWGPYLSERAWGTVREDYSADGDAWSSFPHDHARSRAYRWSEDGLGGLCDAKQELCFAWAFWNGVDPILKERLYGLTSHEGNHGEDAKEYWWYLDSTPSHSWMRWRYVYPQQRFPYEDLLTENQRRARTDGEYELLDTGVLEHGYWDITVDYAKAAPDDLCLELTAVNRGPAQATLHVLPTLWFRNRWSWSDDAVKPSVSLVDGALQAGRMVLSGPGEPLFCENESNTARLWSQPGPLYPKDGINDHVVSGAPTVNPQSTGTKAALWSRLTVAAGASATLRVRLAPTPSSVDFDAILSARSTEADAFYARLAPKATDEERKVLRQALGGMLWSKQYYRYDVQRWLDGDPGQPAPPPERLTARNAGWRHLDASDVISMPDTWEYPWFAAWDLAFHCIALAHVDPAFAKAQLRLMTREWYMHPNGQLPAYEWNFGDVNPPVHAIAALAVYELDGSTDRDWLARIFHKLLLGFTWWANVKDPEGDHLFGGGFLGMDNVGPFNRSEPLPDGLILEQADGTGWMALYCLSMLEIALVLAEHDPSYEDVAVKFFEHFTLIARAINESGLWDEADGFYYDQVRRPGQESWPVRVRSMSGLIPFCAVAIGSLGAGRLKEFRGRVTAFLADRPEYASSVNLEGDPAFMAVVGVEQLPRIIERLADPAEFLSDHGLRSLSAAYRDRPFEFWAAGKIAATVDYEPAESSSPLFGGNSNWRGPIWFPVNYLVIGALERFGRRIPDRFEFPRGSGAELTLSEIGVELASRLVGLFTGERPALVDQASLGDDLMFHEYFHGDSGRGLGASHQTGWTGLVADMVIRLSNARD